MRTMLAASSNALRSSAGRPSPLSCSHGGPSEFRLCVCITIFVASAALSREELWMHTLLVLLVLVVLQLRYGPMSTGVDGLCTVGRSGRLVICAFVAGVTCGCYLRSELECNFFIRPIVDHWLLSACRVG